ncbi:mechanosensitive ion channel family protein [Erythrobacter sp.]|uniref:mechanosensitive ion channel family protein n=1 Tax=Erythrobacter sp. TaxID=1042 RepID=UPI0025E7D79C|nr:mechanosensitive ion channel family protein [Erythrobacter sp.]
MPLSAHGMDGFAQFLAGQQPWLQSLIGVTLLALAALAANYLLKHVILRAAAPWLDRKSKTIDKAVGWLVTVIPLLIVANGIYLVSYLPDRVREVTANIAQTLIVLSIALAIVKALTYLNELYERLPQSRNRPIKGYLQVVKIIVLCGAALIVISILIDQSPLLLLSGLGAITAVLLLVFKDTILSLVASVQLSTNDMLRVGDWIDMPSMDADGDVIDISLHTVKVQNFDKTITTIPTHLLVSDSYRNWRGMKDAGARRIKRALPIDQSTIRFLTDDEVAALHRFRLLRPYLAEKRAEIAEWNTREILGEENPINRRRLTNLGTFRAYALAYLSHHPRVSDGFTVMVRQLEPSAQGLPMELYCFADTTVWAEYEGVQSDIFDHILSILPEFHLRLFQEPSGVDFGSLTTGDRI